MNNNTDYSRLTRDLQKMPGFIRDALEKEKLSLLFYDRPAYQQNDYLAWITRAKRPETIQKRLNQMLDELRRGDVYMKMSWCPRR